MKKYEEFLNTTDLEVVTDGSDAKVKQDLWIEKNKDEIDKMMRRQGGMHLKFNPLTRWTFVFNSEKMYKRMKAEANDAARPSGSEDNELLVEAIDAVHRKANKIIDRAMSDLEDKYPEAFVSWYERVKKEAAKGRPNSDMLRLFVGRY